MVKMSKELSWGYKRLNSFLQHRYTNKVKNVNILVFGLDSSRRPYWEIGSQTNDNVVHVSNVNANVNVKLCKQNLKPFFYWSLAGLPFTLTQTSRFMHLDVTAFRSFFLLRAFDGMLTASPGRQRQRHRTARTHAATVRRCFRRGLACLRFDPIARHAGAD